MEELNYVSKDERILSNIFQCLEPVPSHYDTCWENTLQPSCIPSSPFTFYFESKLARLTLN